MTRFQCRKHIPLNVLHVMGCYWISFSPHKIIAAENKNPARDFEFFYVRKLSTSLAERLKESLVQYSAGTRHWVVISPWQLILDHLSITAKSEIINSYSLMEKYVITGYVSRKAGQVSPLRYDQKCWNRGIGDTPSPTWNTGAQLRNSS